MKTDGAVLARMAELIKVDEIRQIPTISSAVRFILRVCKEHEEVYFDTTDLPPFPVKFVTDALCDAAERLRARAYEKREKNFRAEYEFEPLRPLDDSFLVWMKYMEDAVRATPTELLGIPQEPPEVKLKSRFEAVVAELWGL